MFYRLAFCSAVALISASISGSAWGHEPTEIRLSGIVDTSFDGVSADGLTASINGHDVPVAADGSYEVLLPVEPYYRIAVDGAPIYRAVQTFGIAEIHDTNCNCLRAPEIDVVARKPGRVELFFAGDVMAGRRFIDPIWEERRLVDPGDPLPDIVRLLEPMKPYIEGADLASVNLESVLAGDELGNAPPKSIVFYSPPELAEALAETGIDHVSLGNNHSNDYLAPGVETTIAAVEAAGLAWSGAGLDEVQALEAARMEANGTPLSLLGFVGWKGRVEPNQVAEPGKSGAAYGSDANIAATVERENAAGRAVIMQYHGSSEYSADPSEDSERRMKLAVDKGAAIVASHHPHVAQGLELYGDSLIAYSTGNFLFDQYFLETHGTYALKVWLDGGRFVRAEIIPLRILDYRPVPAVGSLREAILTRVGSLSAQHGTAVIRNGGHGIVLPFRLEEAGQHAEPDANCQKDHDLLHSGDFENAEFGDAVDRSLKLEGGTFDFDFAGTDGHFLKLTSSRPGDALSLTTATFFRDVPGRRVTVSGKIRVSQPVLLSVASQRRPASMARFSALEEVPFEEHTDSRFEDGNDWQEFALSFDLDDADGVTPFRPRLEFSALEPDSNRALSIDLDDLQILARKVEADGHQVNFCRTRVRTYPCQTIGSADRGD